MDKVPLKKYKWHKNFGQQYRYNDVALTMAEQAALIKINEIIDWINDQPEKPKKINKYTKKQAD